MQLKILEACWWFWGKEGDFGETTRSSGILSKNLWMLAAGLWLNQKLVKVKKKNWGKHVNGVPMTSCLLCEGDFWNFFRSTRKMFSRDFSRIPSNIPPGIYQVAHLGMFFEILPELLLLIGPRILPQIPPRISPEVSQKIPKRLFRKSFHVAAFSHS